MTAQRLTTSSPPELLAVLAEGPEPSVRPSVIEDWQHPPKAVCRALLTDSHPHIRRAAASAYSPPSDLLPVFLADRETRAIAVRYVGPSPELAPDPESGVREAVAAHPNLFTEPRDLLAGDVDAFVRNASAARPDTPSTRRRASWPRWRVTIP